MRDILAELAKPGRDPRPAFVTATFQEGVEKVSDLKPGMLLEGTVTNVAAFGAFVDIGVHQDGLVHVSQLADRFVKDPHEVVKVGDVVKVRSWKLTCPENGSASRCAGTQGPATRRRRRGSNDRQSRSADRRESRIPGQQIQGALAQRCSTR